jgi:hypothetical protein
MLVPGRVVVPDLGKEREKKAIMKSLKFHSKPEIRGLLSRLCLSSFDRGRISEEHYSDFGDVGDSVTQLP